MYVSKSIEHTPPRVIPNANYGLWVIMMCPCKFISCNKCTTLVEMGKATHCRGRRYMGNLLPSPQFCHKLKTAIQNKPFLKNQFTRMNYIFMCQLKLQCDLPFK